MMLLKLYFILTLYALVEAELTIHRKALCANLGQAYCESTDIFTNEDKKTTFCSKRNASCIDNCDKCQCEMSKVFFSYEHGCQSLDESETLLKAPSCFFHLIGDLNHYIPAIHSTTFLGGACRPLFEKHSPLPSLAQCVITNMFSVNEIQGKLDVFSEEIFTIRKPYNYNCLACTDSSCEFKELVGKFVYLSMECTRTTNNMKVQTCFMMRVNGRHTLNGTITEIDKGKNGQKKNNNGTLSLVVSEKGMNVVVVAGVVCGCLLLGIIFIALLFWCRKKNEALKRRNMNGGSYPSGHKGDNDTFFNSEPQYEDITLLSTDFRNRNKTADVGLNVYSSVMDMDEECDTETMKIHKEANNIYYQSSLKVNEPNEPVSNEDEVDDNLNVVNSEPPSIPAEEVLLEDKLERKLQVNPRNVRKDGYDQVGSVIPDGDSQPLLNRNYDKVDSVVPANELPPESDQHMSTSKRYDEVGSVIPSNEPPSRKPKNKYDKVGSVIPIGSEMQV